MQFNLETADNAKLFTNYGSGFIEIDGKIYRCGVCLHGNNVISNWNETDPKSLNIACFTDVLVAKPEILVLGTGRQLIFPDPRLLVNLQKQGTVIETMATDAACRTYNILASERRKVAAALMLIEP